jgi:CRP-like cAMP-binding protein
MSLTPCSLVVLEKDAFLEAVTGHPRAAEEVDREVDRRLAEQSVDTP